MIVDRKRQKKIGGYRHEDRRYLSFIFLYLLLSPFIFLYLLLSPFIFSSCKADSEYTTWPCRFAYDNSLHLDPTLASAMNIDSRGVFCKIWESSMGGLVLHVQSNQGGAATHQPVTEIERQTNYILGLNNGIIVGFQTMNTQPYGGFVAYDAQCPNCVRRENNTINPKYPVSMSTSGIASCGVCGKKYDLNNGGIIQNGEEGDVGLQKYLATTTGPNGFLSVGTKR